jgi:hypothetical protein
MWQLNSSQVGLVFIGAALPAMLGQSHAFGDTFDKLRLKISQSTPGSWLVNGSHGRGVGLVHLSIFLRAVLDRRRYSCKFGLFRHRVCVREWVVTIRRSDPLMSTSRYL